MASALKPRIVIQNQVDRLEVSLRTLQIDDFELVHKWLSDPYIIQLTFVISGPNSEQIMPFSEALAEQYLNMLVTDPKRKTYAIEVNGQHVGNIGLKDYNEEFKRCEIFVEVGEADFRSKGVGKAAIAILLDYAFDALNLKEIRLEVLEFNSAAIHVYRKLGFVSTGTTGWHYDNHGQYWQVHGMLVGRDKWKFVRAQLQLPVNIVTRQVNKTEN
ncbi:MAG: GNAT family protein [bacterium]|nr:GNAT family protein [bacterium]